MVGQNLIQMRVKDFYKGATLNMTVQIANLDIWKENLILINLS